MTIDPRNDPTAPGGAAEQLATKDRRIAEMEEENERLTERVFDLSAAVTAHLRGEAQEHAVRWFKEHGEWRERGGRESGGKASDSSGGAGVEVARPGLSPTVAAVNPAAPDMTTVIPGRSAEAQLKNALACIRALEAELASKQEDYDDLDSQLHGVLKHLDVVHECPSDCQQGIPRGVRELEKERDE